MTTARISSRRNTVLPRVLLLTLAIAWTSGCEAVNHLRDAQEAFSNGAALENAARFDGGAVDGEASMADAFSTGSSWPAPSSARASSRRPETPPGGVGNAPWPWWPRSTGPVSRARI